MKPSLLKTKLILLALLVSSITAGAAGGGTTQYFYFPDEQIRLSAPAGWFGHADCATPGEHNQLSISLEKINDIDSDMFSTGLTIVPHMETKVGLQFRTSREAAKALSYEPMLKMGKLKGPPDEFEINTPIGKLYCFEYREIDGKKGSFSTIQGYVRNAQGLHAVWMESKAQTWDRYKPVLLAIAQSIEFTFSSQAQDLEIYSDTPTIKGALYKQYSPSLLKDIHATFGHLRVGMDETEYHKIAGAGKWTGWFEGVKLTWGNKANAWVGRSGETPSDQGYTDTYCIANRISGVEFLAVRVSNGKISDIKKLDRKPPQDFDMSVWDRKYAGFLRDRVNITRELLEELKSWRVEKNKAINAYQLVQGLSLGMDEQDYLSQAQAFIVFVGNAFQRVVPGVLEIANLEPKITRYIYGYLHDGDQKILGFVEVEGGRIRKIAKGNP